MSALPSCPACQVRTSDAFCGACGESMSPARPTMGDLVRGTFGGLTSTDHALGRTLKGMLLEPAVFTDRWLRGDRRRHLSPVRTLVWGLAFFFLMYRLLGKDVMAFGGIDISVSGTDKAVFKDELKRQTERWLQPLMLLTLPVLAVVHRILYRGRGRSYVDCLVLVAFVEGFLFFTRGVIAPLGELWPGKAFLIRITLVAVWSVRSAQGFFGVSLRRAIVLELIARVLHAVLAFILIAAVTIPLAVLSMD